MFRRSFIQRITCAGVAGLATSAATKAGQHKSVTYRVTGFSCVTCAVGLEALLRRQNGITRADAKYPSGMVHIDFDPALISEKMLKSYIAEMGFGVAD